MKLGVLAGLTFPRLTVGGDLAPAWDWVGYSFTICAGIGTIAGLYPALQAMYKNVLEALRYE